MALRFVRHKSIFMSMPVAAIGDTTLSISIVGRHRVSGCGKGLNN